MRLFTDLLCWCAARFLAWWWKHDNEPVRCDGGMEEMQPIAETHGVKIYGLSDFDHEP